jgi:hypothetical protein
MRKIDQPQACPPAPAAPLQIPGVIENNPVKFLLGQALAVGFLIVVGRSWHGLPPPSGTR